MRISVKVGKLFYCEKGLRLLIKEKMTANYRLLPTTIGNKYQFFCDVSNALICTTAPVKADTPDEELTLAWNIYAKAHFNQCHKCGRWVINEMYNPDVLNCVLCTPIEEYPDFCPECGAKTNNTAYFCHMCGTRLLYGGEAENEKTVYE